MRALLKQLAWKCAAAQRVEDVLLIVVVTKKQGGGRRLSRRVWRETLQLQELLWQIASIPRYRNGSNYSW